MRVGCAGRLVGGLHAELRADGRPGQDPAHRRIGSTVQEYAQKLRSDFSSDNRFVDLDFAFNTGGTVRSASTRDGPRPSIIRIEGKDLASARKLAEKIRKKSTEIDGVVDPRIMQRLDYPEYIIEVDRVQGALPA